MTSRASSHPHLELVARYYDGCNRGDVGAMTATFTPDVVHYNKTGAERAGEEIIRGGG